MSRIPIIHCIGDSHSSIFSGMDRIQPSWPASSSDQLPWFKTHHIGPALAYNLTKSGTTSQGWYSLWDVIASQTYRWVYERCIKELKKILSLIGLKIS